MVSWNRYLIAALALVGLLFTAIPAPADELPSSPDPSRLQARAGEAEKAEKWEQALDLYLKAYTEGQHTGELRERIRVCLRNTSQLRRQRDSAFHQFVLSLSVAESLNLYAEVLGRLSAIYYDRDRATAARLFGLGVDELDRALGNAEFRTANLDPAAGAKVAKFQRSLRDGWKARLPENPREARHAVREVIAEAQQSLGIANPSAVVFEFLCGACSGLDEFTLYVNPVATEFSSPVLELASYGILVRVAPSELLVDGVIPGSWAAFHTSLRKGDRISRVNGRALDPNNPASLSQLLRDPGMAGHELEFSPAENPIATASARLPIPLPSVFGGDVVVPKDGVAYLRLAAFRDSTLRELDDALLSLKARGMRVLVLDLRGNPGGLFTAGIQVAQRFLPSGVLVTTQGQSPEFANRVFSSDSGMAALDVPLVVLIDTKTMSAAEAVAAAWKENNRVTLVGLPTFGKGVIQSPIRLQAIDRTDGSASRSGVLILTVASMAGPRGTAINGLGVVPDILEVEPARQLDAAIAKALELAAGLR